MNDILILTLIAAAVLAAVCRQVIAGTRTKLRDISRTLNRILESGSSEHVCVFTDDPALAELAAQINRILDDRQKREAAYRRTEIASKKMLSNISHDIKTPMTVILGYLEILRMEDSGNEMLQKAERKAQQVMELVNEFFTLAKLEAGDANLTLAKLDVCEVCRESVLDFYALLAQKEFTVEAAIPETAVYAQADREALQRILFNLIANAVRYGGDGRYLGIAVAESDQTVSISVTDHGRGIDPAFAENVFDRLFTMEDSRNRKIQGNGLGLTIAKNLALQMGGDVTLQSEPFVKTVFTVRLKKDWTKEICKIPARVLKIPAGRMGSRKEADGYVLSSANKPFDKNPEGEDAGL